MINSRSDIYYIWSLNVNLRRSACATPRRPDWYAAGRRSSSAARRPKGAGRRTGGVAAQHLSRRSYSSAQPNLAFELDRVLRLPGRKTESTAAVAEADAATDPVPNDAVGRTAGRPSSSPAASDAGSRRSPSTFEVKNSDGTFLLDAGREDFAATESAAPSTSFGCRRRAAPPRP